MLRGIARQVLAATIVFALAFPSFAFPSPATGSRADSDDSNSGLRPLIERYSADRVSLARMYDAPLSEVRRARFTEFYKDWLGKLQKVDFDHLDQEGKVDYLLFDDHLRDRLRDLATREKQDAEISSLVPFAKIIVDLDESRRRMEIPKPEQAAAALSQMVKDISKTREAAEAGLTENSKATETARESGAGESNRAYGGPNWEDSIRGRIARRGSEPDQLASRTLAEKTRCM